MSRIPGRPDPYDFTNSPRWIYTLFQRLTHIPDLTTLSMKNRGPVSKWHGIKGFLYLRVGRGWRPPCSETRTCTKVPKNSISYRKRPGSAASCSSGLR